MPSTAGNPKRRQMRCRQSNRPKRPLERLFGARCRRLGLRACTMSKLNDEVADGSGTAVDKNALAALQPAIVEKHCAGRRRDDRHPTGFDEAQSHWLAREA